MKNQKTFKGGKLITKKIISILFLSVLITTAQSQSAKAIFCSNCTQEVSENIRFGKDIAESLTQTALQTATKISTYLLQYKEFTLDLMVTKLRDSLIKQVQNSTIKWIQSGYKGKPTFLTNPEGMVQDIVANQMYLVTNDIQKALVGGTKDLQLILLKEARNMNDQSQAFQNSIKPTIGTTIKNSCCSDAGLKAVQQANNYTDAQLANFKASVCSIDPSTNEGAEKLKTVFANNYACGGADALAELFRNPTANTQYGQAQAALAYVQAGIDKNKDQLKTNTIAGQGYLPNTTCTKTVKTDDGVGGVYEACADGGQKILDPGQTAKAANDTALKSGVNTLTNAHEFSDIVTSAISAIGDAFISDLTQRATSLVTGAVNNGVNSLTGFINNQGAALGSSINSGFTVTPGSPQTTNPGSSVSSSTNTQDLTSSTPVPISAADNLTLLSPLIDQVQQSLAQHELYIAAVNTEKAAYANQGLAVTNLAQCYASLPASLQQTAGVVSGQSYVNTRQDYVGGKLIAIGIILEDLQASKAQANELISAMKSNRDLSQATKYMSQVNNLITGSLLKNASDLNQYKSDSQTTIDALTTESTDIIAPRQSDCSCMKANQIECQGGSPVNAGGGSAGGQ